MSDRREPEQKHIQVVARDGTYQHLTPPALDVLLEKNNVMKFKRSSGWVTIGIEPIRVKDRRESPRFKALPRALVSIPQGPKTRPYHIVDISDSGLSFRYLGESINSTGIFSVSLYHEDDLVVSDLPVKNVSDIGLVDVYVPVRRRSLCFESLSFEQQNKLVNFIEGFTESLH